MFSPTQLEFPLYFYIYIRLQYYFFGGKETETYFLDFSFIPRKSKPSENKNLRQFSAVNVPISELL